MTVEPDGVHAPAELGHADAGRVGAAAADLGEMVAAGFEVPPGFVVGTGPVREAPGVPAALRARIAHAYSGLGISPGGRPLVVSVWPSPPGPHVGYGTRRTTVRGHDALVEAITRCRAGGAAAVVVQAVPPVQRSGVACTLDPLTGDEDHVVVRAVLGRSDVVLDGSVEPDTYVVRHPGGELVSVHVGYQTHQVVRGRDAHDLRTTLDPWHAGARVLDDAEAATIARTARQVREHFGRPYDVEWAMVARRLWLLATWPSCPRLPEMRPQARAAGAGV